MHSMPIYAHISKPKNCTFCWCIFLFCCCCSSSIIVRTSLELLQRELEYHYTSEQWLIHFLVILIQGILWELLLVLESLSFPEGFIWLTTLLWHSRLSSFSLSLQIGDSFTSKKSSLVSVPPLHSSRNRSGDIGGDRHKESSCKLELCFLLLLLLLPLLLPPTGRIGVLSNSGDLNCWKHSKIDIVCNQILPCSRGSFFTSSPSNRTIQAPIQ